MNYAETLAYWYLRLNGFFPLSRFVLHRDGDRNYNTDCDLLAVRFPHVSEPVGGNPMDWDTQLFEAFHCGIENPAGRPAERAQIIALIVQCKGGSSRDIVADVRRSFARDRLAYAINRMGFFDEARRVDIAHRLHDAPYFEVENYIFGKLLIAENARPVRSRGPWRELPIEGVIEFIGRRIRDYKDEKRNAWDKFPSDLLQYLIWHPPAGEQ